MRHPNNILVPFVFSMVLLTATTQHLMAAASVTTAGAQSFVVKTVVENVDSCSVNITPGAGVMPPAIGVVSNSVPATAQSFIAVATGITPNTYTYDLTCHSAYWANILHAYDSLTVTGTPAPTSASLSLSIPSGLPSTAVTATWSANNTPTSYDYMIDNNGTVVPLGALTATTFKGSDFGWNANGTHSIKIRGSNAGGTGPWSASQSYTINIPPPTVNLFFSLKQKTKSLLQGLISVATSPRENTTTEIFVYNK